MEEDELDINPFFRALQSTYSSIYDKAQETCCLICVPQSACLQHAIITEKFINVHILKPSPFFKGQYITLYSDKHVASLTDDGTHIYTQEGFPTKVKVKILNEELGYNKDYKPYKILIIERPLDQNVLKKQKDDKANRSSEVIPNFSLKECREFLRSFPELKKVLEELEANIRQFNQNYLLLQDYIDDAISRLNSIVETTSEKCLKSCQKKLVNSKSRDVMSATVETYVLASVHNKLFPVICTKFSTEDKRMLDTCVTLNGLTPDQLNVPEQFCCPLPSAVVELANLDRLQTPIEKLYCLKSTFDNMTEEIHNHIEMLQPPGISTEAMPCLTSDDLIPILVTVIVRAKCAHLHSDIYYMENFNWSASAKDRDNLSYCLVTFKAAVQYMTSPEFNMTQLHKDLAQNEMSLDEIMAINKDLNTQTPTSSKNSMSNMKSWRPRTTSQSRLDQQLENIAKMLDETSTQDNLEKLKRKSPIVSSVFNGSYQSPSPSTVTDNPTSNTKTEKKDKGEFLSQLENDIFLSS